jgi:biopolymer transport protein ExbD
MKTLSKAKDDAGAGEIDLTPMLDVVFILLIFFIVTSVFVKEAGYDVIRPQATTTSQISVEPIFIAIDPSGQIWMDGDIVLERNLRLKIEQRLADTPNAGVVIQADQDATNDHVLVIMNASREANVASIQIAAEK